MPCSGENQSMRIWQGTPQYSARTTPSAAPLASSAQAVGCVQTDFWSFVMKPWSFGLTISRVCAAIHSA